MANESPTSDGPVFHRNGGSFAQSDLGRGLYKVLEAVASLKFTVILFGMAIFLILAGTLVQTEKDIHDVVKDHFHPWVTSFPVRIFAPKAFFPERGEISEDLVFPFFGGAAIGAAMFLNLFAAHTIRFKIQSTGARLWGGVGVIGLGALVTFMVIHSGSNPDGFQAEPLIEWDVLWQCLKFGAGALWVALASSLLKIDAKRRLERWSIIGLTLLTGAGLVYLFWQGDDFKLNDSSMRILWQLIKGTAAGLVLLAGCILVFKKRAGIVLLHGGVGLMMFSELFVTMNNEENQMPIIEGQTVNWVQDGHNAELAIIDRSDRKKPKVIVVPASRLLAINETERRLGGDELPFEIQVLQFYENSDLMIRYDASRRGAYKYRDVKDRKKGVGTDADSRFDEPAAVLEIFDKETGNSAGRFLVSANMGLNEQQIRVGGKIYEIDLRYKRTYKPYSVHLIDVRSDKYIGTPINKNFSSDVQFVDPSRDIAKERRRIWMNNPVRYAGETFYQSNYGQQAIFKPLVDPDTGLITGVQPDRNAEPRLFNSLIVDVRETTVLSVVTNQGWMIPYVACMIVATGMLAHFWLVLLRFLNRRAAGSIVTGGKEAAAAVAEKAGTTGKGADLSNAKSSPLAPDKAAVWFPTAIGAIFALWLVSKMFVRSPGEGKMDIDKFGKLPVVSSARLKPFDSFARNNLRALSHKEEVVDGDNEKQDAIVWFLDVIANPKKAAKYRVFRIEHLEALNLLNLPPRKGYRYTLNEVRTPDNRTIISEQLRDREARKKNKQRPTKVQDKFVELQTKLRRYDSLVNSFVVPPKEVKGSESAFVLFLMRYRDEISQVPLAAPNPGDEDRPWLPLSNLAGKYWARQLAKSVGAKSWNELYRHVLQAQLDQETRDELERRAQFRAVRQLQGRVPDPMKLVRDRWDEMSPAIKQEIYRKIIGEGLRELTADTKFSDEDSELVIALVEIIQAARDNDVAAFNAGIETYNAKLADAEPKDYDVDKLAFESWISHFAPYYHSAALYLVAFILAALGWLGWSRPLNRAAFLLIAGAFVVHTLSLLARMYISGRWGVTVTNLYSSAVFIGWAACIFGMALEVVYKMGIGNLIASVAGFSTLVIAHYLSFDGDTISVMQAVLDTNFWLATHVTTVTLGYSATFVAGLLGMLYILGGVASPSLTADMGKVISRMIHGTLCFAIFFSFVGTVLGGLWADDSWGRFWGWDPKENGALIIVLWNALILHARWGRMAGDRGVAVLAIVGNIVTAWSWFGVNMLNVGLHSYGEQEGTKEKLAIWWIANLVILFIGCLPKDLWWSFRNRQPGGSA